jgi:uncharacterized protein YqjF (DUF2071 family)
VRRLVPAELPLDVIDGDAWIGVTPFEVRGLRLRALPPVPGVSRFPELNVRTYVTLDDKPGICFFRLYAGSRLAVAGARATYRLPYVHARMGVAADAGRTAYRCETRAAAFAGRYGPVGPVAPAGPGTLEHRLTERYSLYTVDRGRVLRADIEHAPWPLQAAEAAIENNTMGAPLGIELAGEPLLHFAARQDVVVSALSRV